jgi:hypothetical protein
MATKNLSRTVIEGGRALYNQRVRRYSNKQARMAAAMTCLKMRADLSGDGIDPPRRRPVWKAFDDKLAPARRWLAAQVGRPWDKVRGEIFARFDTRTTPGRHIIFCHMLLWVEPSDPARRGYYPSFKVDRHGILRWEVDHRHRGTHIGGPWLATSREREIAGWLAGRLVGERGDSFFWFVLTPYDAFRQGTRLTESDAAFWLAIPAWYRKKHTAGTDNVCIDH